MFLPHFDVNMETIFYIITKLITTHKAFVYFKILQHNVKAGLCPLWRRRKAIWRNVWSIWNETISLVTLGSKELWLDEKNHTTVKPDLTTASRRMNTYIENRTELRNLQILKKCWKKQVSFCYRSSPVSRKALTLHWKLQELKKYPWKNCGCSQPRGHLIWVLNELEGACKWR